MKLNYHKSGLFLLMMVFSFLILANLSHAAVDESLFIVENLQVNDIPYDDGSGLVLSWKPLPKERRIIEYRVYRGITPDSLFYIGRIDVNVKTGVPGDVMYYYDNDFNYFVDTQAFGKLQREKNQPKDSPLYRRYPRDVNITGPRLEHYDILGVIPEKDFYYKNKKIEVTTEEDTTVYAGLKLRNFTQLAKKLIPDHEYYYTVLAVNEARKYYPHCEPAIGIPRENAPEQVKLYSVYVEDIQRIQFEWTLPTFTDDHYYHRVYLLEREDLAKFNDFIAEQKLLEENDLAVKIDSTLTKLEPKVENPAKLIYQRYSAYPYTPSKTASIDLVNGKITRDKPYVNLFTGEEIEVDIDLDLDNMDDYLFIFSLYDAATYETFTETDEVDIIDSTQLPEVPEFMIKDRKNDKGDYNTILWGKPVVYLTNSSYLNDSKTKLLVNYEYKTHENYKVRNIYFNVYDEEGKLIETINEFYQDNSIKINIPENTWTLNFEMTFKCNRDIGEDYILTQSISYDDQTKSLVPGKIYLGDEDLRANEYFIYKRNYYDEEFRLAKKMQGTQRELQDNIRYLNSHFKLVKNYDAEKQLFLFSPTFSVRIDAEHDNMIGTNLYPSEVQASLDQYRETITELTASKDTLITEEDIAAVDEQLEYYQERLDRMENDPILKEAASIKNRKQRLKYLHRARQVAKNSFEYKIVKTDGKGRFTETSVFVREETKQAHVKKKFKEIFAGLGKDHFFPYSNWFKTTMLPALIASFIFGCLVYIMISKAKRGHDLYIRPIAGIEEIDNAIGRATEMGKPILFVPGLSSIQDVATLAGLAILGRVAKKAAEYDTKILVPVRDYIVLPIAQEIVKEAHYEAGRPDTHDKNSVFFITTAQFAFVAGVNGIMIREKTATNFYMGMFWAEALLMTETGSSTGAIQISGTDAVTQIPFFITTCDYTLIGEELYAASAYLAKEPLQLGTLKAVDYFKMLILIFVISGTILSTVHLTFLINSFPEQ